jgi:hypothetical protein
MPNRVVDLFACWWTGGHFRSAIMWKIVPSCLMRCLWTEGNDKNFKNQERTLEELRSFFFYSLFTWTIVFLAPLVISFKDFLVRFSSSIQAFSCELLVY